MAVPDDGGPSEHYSVKSVCRSCACIIVRFLRLYPLGFVKPNALGSFQTSGMAVFSDFLKDGSTYGLGYIRVVSSKLTISSLISLFIDLSITLDHQINPLIHELVNPLNTKYLINQ